MFILNEYTYYWYFTSLFNHSICRRKATSWFSDLWSMWKGYIFLFSLLPFPLPFIFFLSLSPFSSFLFLSLNKYRKPKVYEVKHNISRYWKGNIVPFPSPLLFFLSFPYFLPFSAHFFLLYNKIIIITWTQVGFFRILGHGVSPSLLQVLKSHVQYWTKSDEG